MLAGGCGAAWGHGRPCLPPSQGKAPLPRTGSHPTGVRHSPSTRTATQGTVFASSGNPPVHKGAASVQGLERSWQLTAASTGQDPLATG